MLKIPKITLENKIVQCPGNIVSDMEGEKVMLNIQNGKYYNLGTLGGEIWNKVNEPIKIKEIVISLLAEYEINQKDCENQVLTFVDSLKNEGLITIVE